MTGDDGMVTRPSQAGNGPTTDRTGACGRGADVSNTCRRRSWTAEQKRCIVAESMEPGASAAIVARRHGINSGQVYAWRQQLLLRGAFAAGADTTSSLVGADVTTTALSARTWPSAQHRSRAPRQRHSRRCPSSRRAGSTPRRQIVFQGGWMRISALRTPLRLIVRAPADGAPT